MPTRTIDATINVCALTGGPIARCSCSWYPRGPVNRGWNYNRSWRYPNPPGRNDAAGALIEVVTTSADQLRGIRSNSSYRW